MILTGSEVARRVAEGSITIDPFSPDLLNPNSYNFRLGDQLLISDEEVFDSATTPHWRPFQVGAEGYLLQPHRLYLATTLETIGSGDFVTSLIGRSSLGRLGLFLQVTADLGNLGAIHRWTLELHAVQPLRIYPGMQIGQVSFWVPQGDVRTYQGSYAAYSAPTPNMGGLMRIAGAG